MDCRVKSGNDTPVDNMLDSIVLARADTVTNHRYIKAARRYVRVFGVGLEW